VRWASATLAALTAAMLLSGCVPPSTGSPAPVPERVASKPNIVFVLTDDLSSDLVQYMPHVLGLERQGTTFSNYFVVDSLCCPSRSAIFTGQYPHDDGVFTNEGPDGGYSAFNRNRDAGKSFPLALQRAGYRTALMGKYLNGYQPKYPAPRGWDEWDVAGNGYHEFNYNLNQNGHMHHYGHAAKDYLTDVLSAKASDFISRSATTGKPFALEVATFSPHHPWTPAPRDQNTFPTLTAPRGKEFDQTPTDAPRWLASEPALSQSDVNVIDADYRKRVESVQSLDLMIGHLEQQLRATNQLSNTYFVFSSDNGLHMGQYRLMPGKQTAFDTDIRVPLVVIGPHVPAGVTSSAMTSSIDLAPTFAQIAGTKLIDRPDGLSMLPLWHGNPPPDTWPKAVLIEHHGPDVLPGDPDRQPPRSGDPPSYEALRTATATYVEYDTGEREYYNLVRDPDELHNVVGTAPPAVVAHLRKQLHALTACEGAAACVSAAE
jgi:N-acetylglucosamine-6-sulfatase